MRNAESDKEPRSKRGLIAAAALVGALILLGVVLAVVNSVNGPEPVQPSPSTDGRATASTPPVDAEQSNADSVCGLKGSKSEGTLAEAPAAEWRYDELGTAYPVNKKYGPAQSDAQSGRTCFQRTPEGAVFAAANAVSQGSAPAPQWSDYFLSERTGGRAALVQDTSNGRGAGSDVRVGVAGFRLLNYTGDAARVEIVVQAVGRGDSVYVSAIYELVWENGDWRWLPSNVNEPLRMAEIPELYGFVIWGA